MNSSKLLKYLIISAVVLLLATPFIVTPSLFFPMITGKAFYFRILTTIIFALWLVLIILDPEYRPKKSLLCWSFFGFLMILLFSNLTGENRLASFWSNFERMEGWVTIVHLYMLFLATANTFTKKVEWSILFNSSVVASIYMAYKVYLQLQDKGWHYRADATLGNSTYLGIYMLMNVFLIIYLLITHSEKITAKITGTKRKVSKILFSPINALYLIAFIVNVLVVFQTDTRGAILGLFGGFFVMGLVMVVLNKNKVLRYSALGLILVTAIISGSIYFFRDSDFINNYSPLKRITTISVTEGTAKARILNWQIATEGVKERPILGWGQSNFNYAFDKHYLPEHHGNESRFDRVHNIIFDWLIAGGVLGLLAYLLIWISFVWIIFRTDKLSTNQKGAILGLMAAYFFHNLFVFDQIVSYIYFVFMLGFAASLGGVEVKSIQKNLSDNMKFILLSAVIIFTPVTIYLVNVPNMRASRDVIDAMQLFRRNDEGGLVYYHDEGLKGNVETFDKILNYGSFGAPEIRGRALLLVNDLSRVDNLEDQDFLEYVNFIYAEMEQQIFEDPTNSLHHYLYGYFLQATGLIEESEKYFLSAIELSPNKQSIRLPLISSYIRNDEGEKAMVLAKETYELDKSHDDIWEAYIRAVSAFDSKQAQAEIKKAIEEGEYDRVEKMLVNNIGRNSESHQNFISLAAFYMQIEEADKALEILYQAKEKFSEIEIQIGKLIAEIEAGNNPIGQSF